jgi:hemin uptake protein HemP
MQMLTRQTSDVTAASDIGGEMAEKRQSQSEWQTGQDANRQPTESPRVWTTEELLGEERLVLIRHGRETYQLRITKNNKLLLQK